MATNNRLKTAFGLAVVLVFNIALVTNATFTHPDDLNFEARVSKSDLIGAQSGIISSTAFPLWPGGSNQRLDPYAPSETSFYANGFTDEHHKPKIDFVLEDGALVRISVSFPPPHTLAMPAFTVKVLTVRSDHVIPTKYYRTKRHHTAIEDSYDENAGLSFDERKHETIMEETLVTPNAQSEAANFALHDPTPMEDLYDYVVVILNVHPRVITSFVYELDSIPDEIFESEKMFDLTPFNSTMHMKFVARYDSKEDALGVWVVRRPPIPDFTFLISVDGRVEMTQNVADPNPSGQGFPLAIPHAKARRHALFRLVVHFYERPRQRHMCFPIARDFVKRVGNELSGPQNVRKFIDQPIPNAQGFKLRFTNDNHRDTLTVSIVQGNPISSLMVSLFVTYDAAKAPHSVRIPMPDEEGDQDAYEDEYSVDTATKGIASLSSSTPSKDAVAERPVLIFREEERHVPYMSPDETGQFGWYSALPMRAESLVRLADARNAGKSARVPSKQIKMSQGEATDEIDDNSDVEDDAEAVLEAIDPARLEKIHLSACVSFNDREGLRHPFEEMGEWIDDFGGNTKRMMTVSTAAYSPDGGMPPPSNAVPLVRNGRFTKSNQGLAAREDLTHGEEVATIPYRVLLTTVTVEGNEWVREVMKNATVFVTKCMELGMNVQQNQHFMLITFFLLMQPSSVFDGTNWRQYFDTIPLDTKPPIPIFYTPAEMSLFRFAPLVGEHVRTMKDLIESEYRTISSQVPWFEEEVNRERYAIARSQVENRVFNISGTLVMIPALDYLGHADDPSIALSFDDKEQYVRLQARRFIPSGGSLTIDYGIEVRNKFDFLTQFGFIPPAAANVAGLRVLRYKQHAADHDEYSNVFLLSTSRDSRQELVFILREDLAAAKSAKEGDTVDQSMITQSELRSAFLALLKKELAAMPPRDSVTVESLSNTDSRSLNLVAMAQSLYDGHRMALEEHIRWATDNKIPL